MKGPTVFEYAIMVIVCIGFALAGLFLLTRFTRLFKSRIRNEILRKNAVAWLVIFCFAFAMTPLNGQFFYAIQQYGLTTAIIAEFGIITMHTLLVFNTARIVVDNARLKRLPFIQHQLIIFFTIVIMTIAVSILIRYLVNDKREQEIGYQILSNAYIGSAVALVFTVGSYLDLERKRRADAKELELSRLRELKTKAELDALHSKVNPHFLYNALNSIADLSVTDGKKARKMTIALADLFRYSINYSQNNYAAIKDEVAMTEVYLQIEKIRFEDQLNYSLHVDDELNYYLVPRFILQSLVENAVKHGLKVTRQMTEISLEVKKYGSGLVVNIADNGPLFPDEITPGYGIKSVYDKLDLLFPGQYEVHFSNQPRKQVSVFIYKLIKNEPSV